MKKNTFLAFIALLLFNTVNAQLLYTENFDNLTIGNVGTDITGIISGKGGWYTLFTDDLHPILSDNSFFAIQ